MDMNEIWKDIEGFEGIYQVSSQGKVKRMKTGRILSSKNGCYRGYPVVQLFKQGKQKTCSVHRLVAMAFIGKPENPLLTDVHHINCDRNDARVENLQWVTSKYNYANRSDSLEDYSI